MSTTSNIRLLTRDDRSESRQIALEAASNTCQTCVNVGATERQISLATGAIAALVGLVRRDIPGLLIAAVGGGLLYRGATGHCHAYDSLGINTNTNDTASQKIGAHKKGSEVRVSKSVLVGKSPNELYTFWRKLENLPSIMTHLESVQVIDERRSHWVAGAPMIAGGQVEWDAEIVDDRPNELIAWRSLPGSGVANHGSVEFTKAPGDRGTYIHVELEYAPPAGKLGTVLARLFGENPEAQIREDMRRFKRMMEIGEVLTIEGQPRGSCFAGVGKLMH